MSLLLFTAFGGMVIAHGGVPSMTIVFAVLVGGALASGGASSINHGLEDQLDVAMQRTKGRPVAAGRVSKRNAHVYGIVLNAVAFVLIFVETNLLAAALAMSGTAIYVFVYTVWLKRATTQNIVIGGAAGAIPPMVGWAAVTGGLELPAWYLFTVIFLWTPPHFWALAILIQEQYRTAGVPMLPVVAGFNATRRAILIYTLILVGLTALMYQTTDQLGIGYLVSAMILGAVYVLLTVRLWWNSTRPAVAGLYKYSLLYLALLYTAMMVDATI
jgi:protoheme IX farnesyltransferase